MESEIQIKPFISFIFYISIHGKAHKNYFPNLYFPYSAMIAPTTINPIGRISASQELPERAITNGIEKKRNSPINATRQPAAIKAYEVRYDPNPIIKYCHCV